MEEELAAAVEHALLFFGKEIEQRARHQTNCQIAQQGGKQAQAVPVPLGMATSLVGHRFLDFVRFQEAMRTLTGAVCAGRIDDLLDFQSNPIMGHAIPGGTKFSSYKQGWPSILDEEDGAALDFFFAKSWGRGLPLKRGLWDRFW